MSFSLPESTPVKTEKKADRDTIEYKLAATINRGLRMFGGVDTTAAANAFNMGVNMFSATLTETAFLDEVVMETSQDFVMGIRDQVAADARRRLISSGLLTIDDPSGPKGTKDVHIPSGERDKYISVVDIFLEQSAEIVVNADSAGEFRTATSMRIHDLVQLVTAELVWLGTESGIVQAKNGVSIVKNRLLKVNPRALKILDIVERLGNELLDCAENPQITLSKKLDATPGIKEHIRSPFLVSLRSKLTEVYREQEAEARAKKRARKHGAKIVDNSTTPTVAAEEPESQINTPKESNANPGSDHEVIYEQPRKIKINSRWSNEPTEAIARTVCVGTKQITIVYDYDPALAGLAKEARMKHATGKGKDAQADRIMLLEAKAYLTGANTVAYAGSGTAKVISKRDRSEDYKNIELRYNGNVRSSHVMRVYYGLSTQGEVLLDTGTPGGLCLVVYAEADKDNEPTVLQRIKGVGIQQIRRGM